MSPGVLRLWRPVCGISAVLLLLAFAFSGCASAPGGGSSPDSSPVSGGISARGALGRRALDSGPLFEGDGGKGIRLAVLEPKAQGSVPGYLPLFAQGLLNNNLKKYSGITLIDRQHLDTTLKEQNIAASGRFSDADYVRIGRLTNAQYLLAGFIQKPSGSHYILQLSLIDSSTGEVRANVIKAGALRQLESGALINEASADLLAQLGIRLTASGRQALMGNTNAVRSESGLARGITAQASGLSVEALFNYTQSIAFDPSQVEALARLNQLSSSISGGSLSQRILDDIQARDRWIEIFKETARFFDEHPPFEITFDPSLTQIGETDFKKRTATLGMRVALTPSEAGFAALNALLEGLEKTGRRGAWGFGGWPLGEINPKTPGTVVFGGNREFDFKLDVALLNERGKTIGRSSITFNTSLRRFNAGDRKVEPSGGEADLMSFFDVKIDDFTPALTIVIRSVNGISASALNASGYMRISPGDLENAPYYRYRANAYANKGDYDRAIADYTEAIKLDPKDSLAYLYRGNLYLIKGDYDRTIADYTQAIRLDPNISLAYNNRGGAYANKGDYDRAIADFTQAIELNPNSGLAYYSRGSAYHNRGATYSDKGDYDRAIADYTQAIRLNPNSSSAYHNRGIVYANKGDYARAIADYTQAIRLNPDDSSMYHNRGIAYANKGAYARAIADYTQAIRLDPNSSSAYSDRGFAYHNLGAAYRDKRYYDRAIADYTQAIRLNPNSSSMYHNRGIAYHNLGVLYYKRGTAARSYYDRAIADYTQAIRLDPNNSSAYSDRGIAYANKRDFTRARADYQKALQLDPNNESARRNLDRLR
jgi:tetratricopeptide (TPR) repeat protein